MTPPRQLSREAIELRRRLIDSLWDDAKFGYIDRSTFVGSCPVCSEAIVVKFADYAARASLRCSAGCSEAEIAARVGLAVVT